MQPFLLAWNQPIRGLQVARRGHRSRARRFPSRRRCGGAPPRLFVGAQTRQSSARRPPQQGHQIPVSHTSRLRGTFRRSSIVRPASGVRRTTQRTVARPAMSGASCYSLLQLSSLPEHVGNAKRGCNRELRAGRARTSARPVSVRPSDRVNVRTMIRPKRISLTRSAGSRARRRICTFSRRRRLTTAWPPTVGSGPRGRRKSRWSTTFAQLAQQASGRSRAG